MASIYKPLKITGMETGLVQSRQDFILPNDAYPVLENAYVWRERIKRKQGCQLLGRLRRVLMAQSLGESQASPWSFNLFTAINLSGTITNITNANPGEVTTTAPHFLQSNQFVTLTNVGGMTEVNGNTYQITVTGASTFTIGVDTTAFGAYTAGGDWETNDTSSEPNKEIEPGSVVIAIAGLGTAFIDNGAGVLNNATPGNIGAINYATGDVGLITTAPAGGLTAVTFNYFPGLPVMGLRTREISTINNEMTVAFDQVYAYRYIGGWQEFIPGTVWTGNDSDFFWSTNYWIGNGNTKIFWVTNFSGTSGDPIRYTNGTVWVDFAPQINAAGDVLAQCLCMLPFRGRMVVFNTLEGANLSLSLPYTNRIRWAQIGNPFTTVSGAVSVVDADAWKDDIRGKGGFLDIPTNEDIISVGFVRDNLVIYCERSTWQLRYTGRSIAPFQIEKVNSELGAESTFSAVQFDTSLVGVGDKGIVQCDSFKSDRIDIKIPDLIFQFNNDNNGPKRVHGIRDFVQRLAFWTYPYKPTEEDDPDLAVAKFPNRRLVYNYENDSWAIFTDSYTALGNFQPQESRKWSQFTGPDGTWENQNYPWINRPSKIPEIIGGNQQGFVEYLDQQVSNDVSLSITDILGQSPLATIVTSPDHNLDSKDVIKITGIPAGTPFASSLNGGIFSIDWLSKDTFSLNVFDPQTGQFNIPQIDAPGIYIGGGKISIRDNFSITSKKFNFLDDGQNIQLGYIDILMPNTIRGAITLNVYMDYDNSRPVNTLPLNIQPATLTPDSFFNSVVPTTVPINRGSSKNWQRVFCAVRASFLTIEWTLSNAQMVGPEQESNVQIDAQILWIRKAGPQLPIGI